MLSVAHVNYVVRLFIPFIIFTSKIALFERIGNATNLYKIPNTSSFINFYFELTP